MYQNRQYTYFFFPRRPQICDSQRQGRELCNHLLQRRLLWDDRLLQTGHHAEAMHLRLPPRRPDRQRGHQPGGPGCDWVRGAQGGDHLLPQGWWVSNLARLCGCHSMPVSREVSFVTCYSRESTHCSSSLWPLLSICYTNQPESVTKVCMCFRMRHYTSEGKTIRAVDFEITALCKFVPVCESKQIHITLILIRRVMNRYFTRESF